MAELANMAIARAEDLDRQFGDDRAQGASFRALVLDAVHRGSVRGPAVASAMSLAHAIEAELAELASLARHYAAPARRVGS